MNIEQINRINAVLKKRTDVLDFIERIRTEEPRKAWATLTWHEKADVLLPAIHAATIQIVEDYYAPIIAKIEAELVSLGVDGP